MVGLAVFFKPNLMPSERAVAQVEGWILAVAQTIPSAALTKW